MTSLHEQARVVGEQARTVRRRWRERDERHARSRIVLTPAQIDGVREWRLFDAMVVGDLALMEEARTWTPPPRFDGR